MDTILAIFEIIGTVSIAISGALVGIHHHMDIFGVTVIGLVSSVGGGIIRDLIVGSTPPRVFVHPRCAVIAIIVSILTFALIYILHKRHIGEEKLKTAIVAPMFWADTLGLGAYTVLGIQLTKGVVGENFSLLLFVGVITGVGGGVLRDMLAITIPAIFQKHIYALATVAGGIVHIVLMSVNETLAIFAGFVVIVLLRFLAAHFKWNLPVIKDE